jgi:hypothetical protein
MARPQADTVEYVPLFTRDGKTLYVLESKFGNDGWAIWFKILKLLGGSPGHFYDFQSDSAWQYLVSKLLVTEDRARQILQTLVSLEAIDKEAYAKNMLWVPNLLVNLEPVYRKRGRPVPNRPAVLETRTQPSSDSRNRNGGDDGVSVPETTQGGKGGKGGKEKIVYTRKSAQDINELVEKDFILNADDNERRQFIQEVQRAISQENEDRPNSSFIWQAKTGSFENDMKGLLYKIDKETKLGILRNAYLSLNEQINWPRWVLLGVRQMLRVSRKTRIVNAYAFVMSLIQKPQEIINAVAEEGLTPTINDVLNANVRRKL